MQVSIGAFSVPAPIQRTLRLADMTPDQVMDILTATGSWCACHIEHEVWEEHHDEYYGPYLSTVCTSSHGFDYRESDRLYYLVFDQLVREDVEEIKGLWHD